MQKLPQQAHETTSRALLHGAFQAALQAADPSYAIPKVLKQLFPQGIRGRCIVIGAGKASASMADALEKYALVHWPQAILSGLVITRYMANDAVRVIHVPTLERQSKWLQLQLAWWESCALKPMRR